MDQISDLEIIAKDQTKIKVNSILLGLLCHKLYENVKKLLDKDASGCKTKQVKLEISNGEVLRVVAQYLTEATGGKRVQLEPITVWPVLHFARHYQINELACLCVEFLQARLSPFNCVPLLLTTMQLPSTGSSKNAIELYIKRNFTKILDKNQEFGLIDFENLMRLLNDDFLNVNNELTVWDAIVKWVIYATDQRKGSIEKLLETVRFGRIQSKYIHDKILNHPLVQTNQIFVKHVQVMIRKCEEYWKFTSKDGRNIPVSRNLLCVRPRTPYQLLMVYGGWIDGFTTGSIEMFDWQTNIWFETQMPSGIKSSYHGLEFVDGKIYIIGGYDSQAIVRFDPATNEVTQLASMIEPRCYVTTCCLNGIIYAMGGRREGQRLDTCERYAPEQNTWSQVASLNIVRSDASAVVYKNKIYLAGGLNQDVERSVEVYDPFTDCWTLIEPMNSPRSSFSLICYHQRLYALGGNDGLERLATAEYFDFQLRKWSPIDNMLHRRSTFRAAVFRDELYAIGGFNGEDALSSVEKYNSVEKKWTMTKFLNHERSGFGVVAFDLELPSAAFTFNGQL